MAQRVVRPRAPAARPEMATHLVVPGDGPRRRGARVRRSRERREQQQPQLHEAHADRRDARGGAHRARQRHGSHAKIGLPKGLCPKQEVHQIFLSMPAAQNHVIAPRKRVHVSYASLLNRSGLRARAPLSRVSRAVSRALAVPMVVPPRRSRRATRACFGGVRTPDTCRRAKVVSRWRCLRLS